GGGRKRSGPRRTGRRAREAWEDGRFAGGDCAGIARRCEDFLAIGLGARDARGAVKRGAGEARTWAAQGDRAMLVRSAVAAAVMMCASDAWAQGAGILRDPEPSNNLPTSAPVLIRRDSGVVTGVLKMTPGDEDYTRFTLVASALMTLVT